MNFEDVIGPPIDLRELKAEAEQRYEKNYFDLPYIKQHVTYVCCKRAAILQQNIDKRENSEELI